MQLWQLAAMLGLVVLVPAVPRLQTAALAEGPNSYAVVREYYDCNFAVCGAQSAR